MAPSLTTLEYLERIDQNTQASANAGTAGITPAGVQAAIEGAIDIDNIQALLTALNNKPAIDSAGVSAALQSSTNIQQIITELLTIDSKLDLSAISTSLTALVTASAKRYTTTIFQDSTNTYYLYRYDENTGGFSNLNLANGQPYTPIAPVRIPDSTDSHLVSEKSYQVLSSAASSPFYSPGEELTKIVSRVNGSAVTIWINDSRGAELPAAPAIAGVQPVEDFTIELIQSIAAKIDQIGGVFVDGAYAGRTLYAAKTNKANEWAIGDLISRRDVTINGASTGGLNLIWQNETQGQPVNNPVFGSDIEPIEIYLNNLLLSAIAQTRSTMLTAAAGSTSANAPTSRELTPNTVALDVNVANVPNVIIDAMPGIAVTSHPPVIVSSLPAVSITAMPNVVISTMPAINVATLPTLNVATLPAVTVGALPVLNVASVPNITVANLPAAFLADINSIKNNTGRLPVFNFQLAEDTTGATFFIRRDNITGVVDLVTFAGAPYTLPPGALIELTDPIVTNRTVEINEFNTLTNNGALWSTGDILTRVRVVDSNTNPATIVSTSWQKADGSVLSTVPVIGADVEDTNKTAITTANATLAAIGNAADSTLPANSAAAGTLKGLSRGVWNAITSGTAQLIAALSTGFDIANSSSAPGAAPTRARLMAAIFNATLPTLANGQSVGLQADINGRLLVSTGVSVSSDGLVTGGAAAFNAGTNILLSVLAAGDIDTMATTGQSYRSATVEIVMSAGITGGVMLFEGSNSQIASSYTQIAVWEEGANVQTGIMLTVINAAASTTRVFTVPLKYRFVRCRIVTAIIGGTIQAFSRFSLDAANYRELATLGFSNQNIGIIGGVIPGISPNNLAKGVNQPINAADSLIPTLLSRVNAITSLQGIASQYIRSIGTRYGSHYVRDETKDKALYSISGNQVNVVAGLTFFTLQAAAGRQLTIKKIKLAPGAAIALNYSASIAIDLGNTITAPGAPTLVGGVSKINNKPGTAPTANQYAATGVIIAGVLPVIIDTMAISAGNNIISTFSWDDSVGEIVITPGQTLSLRFASLVGVANNISFSVWVTDEPV